MKKNFDWDWIKGHINPANFWDENEIKSLPYIKENFNDAQQIREWEAQGHQFRTGELFDMRHAAQPSTTNKLIAWANERNIEHVGVSYYKMKSGDILPSHADSYKKYIEIYNLTDRIESIVRYIFFLEDRKHGHVFEVDNKIFDWKAGDYIGWRYNTLHLAANLGSLDRFTIQLTGVIRENY